MSFKALLHKQLLEVNLWLLQDRKTGKARTKRGIIGMLILYIFLFGFLGVVFFGMGITMCKPLVSAGLGWLYHAFMGMVAILFGIFGSVFNTYSTLYKAKDNEFLLSLPVKSTHILLVRLIGVWMWSAIYEFLVFLPAEIVYWINVPVSFLTVILDILIMLLVSIFVLSLSCILGWVVAKVSSRLKNKNIVSVLLSLVFFGVYYAFCFKANSILQSMIANAATIGDKIRGWGYPLFILGKAAEGDGVSFLIFAAIVIALFAAVILIMIRSFIKLAQLSGMQYTAKADFKMTKQKHYSAQRAMLRKERMRFTSSANYMLNCAIGVVFIVAIGVAALIFQEKLRSMVTQVGMSSETMIAIALAALCYCANMTDITAPSVSLEGKNLWIAQSLPIRTFDVLKAKLKLHLIVTGVPMLVCEILVIVALRPDPVSAAFMLVIPMLYVLLNGLFGLFMNLKRPNLTWTSEIVPIKQSMSVTVVVLGGMGFTLLLAGLYFFAAPLMSAKGYFAFVTLLLTAVNVLLVIWLKKKGCTIFRSLHS